MFGCLFTLLNSDLKIWSAWFRYFICVPTQCTQPQGSISFHKKAHFLWLTRYFSHFCIYAWINNKRNERTMDVSLVMSVLWKEKGMTSLCVVNNVITLIARWCVQLAMNFNGLQMAVYLSTDKNNVNHTMTVWLKRTAFINL